jgi:hypothetical protein
MTKPAWTPPAPPTPVAEVLTAFTITGLEGAVLETVLNHGYSLTEALISVVVTGAVATCSALAILRRVNPFAGEGGTQPPQPA